jgi:hypothetical protein
MLFTISLIKSIRMRSSDHVVCMGDISIVCKFYSENRKGRDPLEDPSLDGRIILNLAKIG